MGKLTKIMSNKASIIDAKGHLLGRLASIAAKQLLFGEHIVVVRCEEILVSGGLVRQKMKYERFVRKKHNSNPRRCGPIHYKNPARIFWRAVRGMLPHKTFRGSIALAKLKCYEGVPSPYDKIKRMVVPHALRVLRKARGRSEVTLGILADSIGWKHLETIKKLEIKRDERAKTLKPLK